MALESSKLFNAILRLDLLNNFKYNKMGFERSATKKFLVSCG